MKRYFFILCILIARQASASDTPLNDYLLSLTPSGQAAYITQHMDRMCHGYGSFYIGMENAIAKEPTALWGIHCNEGINYLVRITRNNAVSMDCRIYEHVYHGHCFQTSSAP